MHTHDHSIEIQSRRAAPCARARHALVSVALLIACGSSAFASGVTVHGGTHVTSSKGVSGHLIAPEINPALTGGVSVLLVGGVLILTSRRKAAPRA